MLSRSEFIRRVLIVFGLGVALLVAWWISGILMLGFGGVVVAVVIRAAAALLARVLPIPMRWASVLVVIALIAGSALLAWLMGDELARQFNALRQALPDIAMRVRGLLEASEAGRTLLSVFEGAINGRMWATAAVGAVSLLASALSDMMIVAFIALYLSVSPRSYTGPFLALVPPRHRDTARATLEDAGGSLRNWLLGQLVAMTFVGGLTALGLWLIGVPHALILGLLAGLLDFVPILGPLVGAVPGVLFAYAVGPTTALYAVAVYFVVQQLEGAVIMPLAQKWAVRLPPVIGLLAVVVFGTMFGVPGFLFGVPLAVVIMVLVRRLYLDRLPPPGDADGSQAQ